MLDMLIIPCKLLEPGQLVHTALGRRWFSSIAHNKTAFQDCTNRLCIEIERPDGSMTFVVCTALEEIDDNYMNCMYRKHFRSTV